MEGHYNQRTGIHWDFFGKKSNPGQQIALPLTVAKKKLITDMGKAGTGGKAVKEK